MSIASVAAQQSSPTATGATAAPATALNSLSGNLNDFLKLLMTQLQNQDPTSPLDTTQFTSQLVQFASVEQQINTNSNLTQLIQLTQAGELTQSAAMIGKQVTVQSDHLTLQNGSGAISFTAPASEKAVVTIANDAGVKIRDATIDAKQGENTWNWDGTDNNGHRVADGAYRVSVTGANADGTTSPLSFGVIGTATGVQKQGNAVVLQLGALSTDFANVQSLGE